MNPATNPAHKVTVTITNSERIMSK
jgi:hypothetical protein